VEPPAVADPIGDRDPGRRPEHRPHGASDDDYGVKVYLAKATDPLWSIDCGGWDSWDDSWPPPCPISIHAPASIVPPTGSDASVLVVDENLGFAHEMWRFSPRGGTTAYAENIEVVDLRSNGIHRNVGLSAAGLPGSGGLLKSYETRTTSPSGTSSGSRRTRTPSTRRLYGRLRAGTSRQR